MSMDITKEQKERLKRIVEKCKNNKFLHFTSVDELISHYEKNKKNGRVLSFNDFISCYEKKLRLVS